MEKEKDLLLLELLKIKEFLVPKFSKKLILDKEKLRNFFNPILEMERDNGYPDPLINNGIWWSGMHRKEIEEITQNDSFFGVYELRKEISHSNFIKELRKKKIIYSFSYLSALSILLEALLSNEVRIAGSSLNIYYEIPRHPKLFCLCAIRTLKKQLIIFDKEIGLRSMVQTGSRFVFFKVKEAYDEENVLKKMTEKQRRSVKDFLENGFRIEEFSKDYVLLRRGLESRVIRETGQVEAI